jgi:hypothetical protein
LKIFELAESTNPINATGVGEQGLRFTYHSLPKTFHIEKLGM